MNERKKIVYIGQFIPPDGNAVAQRVFANSLLIESCGYIPVLIGYSKNVNTVTKLENCYFETYVLPYPKSFKQWILQGSCISNYTKILEKIGCEYISYVITCDLHSIAQSKLRNFLKKKKIVYIEDTMEWIRHSRKKNIKTCFKDIDTYFRMKYQHIKTNNLICISETLTNYYMNRNCNVIKLPVLIDYDAEKWNLKIDYVPNTVKTLIYAGDAGSIGYKERLDYVIESACKIYDIGYIFLIKIIGMTEEDFVKQCPTIASHKNFKNVTRFYGRQEHLFCLKEIKQADASIIIRENTHEMKCGFPTKLSETLRLGTPPIITPIDGYSNYVRPNIDTFMLNECSLDSVENMLKYIHNLNDEELICIHNQCLKNTNFHYKKYKEEFLIYLEKIKIQ